VLLPGGIAGTLRQACDWLLARLPRGEPAGPPAPLPAPTASTASMVSSGD
jgi:hypothetical protein